jgi:hypothetical protein
MLCLDVSSQLSLLNSAGSDGKERHCAAPPKATMNHFSVLLRADPGLYTYTCHGCGAPCKGRLPSPGRAGYDAPTGGVVEPRGY